MQTPKLPTEKTKKNFEDAIHRCSILWGATDEAKCIGLALELLLPVTPLYPTYPCRLGEPTWV